ncbi:MAG: hypothetical protein LW847_00075 [Burkholderiales bacterium]|jgi:hypothetical protein|nr:hypothetical protein [Burkholderiales bacterium]
MKRALFVVGGAALFAALAFIAGALVTNWYSDNFAKSDSDINASVGVFLLLWPFIAAFGGLFGNWLYRQKLPQGNRCQARIHLYRKTRK